MLQFILGASGAGKSTILYQKIIQESMGHPKQNFYVIVPDQYTMQVQSAMVKLHPAHAFMNIDILSFSRLARKIFEEVGTKQLPVLDDTGKSLILRHVADLHMEELPIIGGNMHRSGYIDEVKSTISEMMQYDISPEGMEPLLQVAGDRPALYHKMKDIQLLYREFKAYIAEKYITAEETLGILKQELPKSEAMWGSVVALDGFTGFTPVQYGVISSLMKIAEKTIVALDMDTDQKIYGGAASEQELFALSKKTLLDLERLEYEREDFTTAPDPGFEPWRTWREEQGRDTIVRGNRIERLQGPQALIFMERNLFRFGNGCYHTGEGEDMPIRIAAMTGVPEEVRHTCIQIKKRLQEDPDLFYRDIAIVCGNLEAYSEELTIAAKQFGLPLYIDQTLNIKLNPLVEYIRSALRIVREDYSFDSVFHFLRCGLCDFTREEVDQLELYVRGLGIRGKSKWKKPFTRQIPKRSRVPEQETITYLEEMNGLRVRFVEQFEALMYARKGSVKDYSRALYEFLEAGKVWEQMENLSRQFEQEGDTVRAGEYHQVYDKVMDLLEQVVALLGNEKIEWKEYMDILDAGFTEIEVGNIPQNVDRIVVGDMERTRLGEIKILFFLGANDSNIPKHTGTGGIISDLDREFLVAGNSGVTLAPTPREQMYQQRLYLYRILTKPTKELYLSYAASDASGNSLRASYLITKLKNMFDGLMEQYPEQLPLEQQLVDQQDAASYLAGMLRRYSAGYMTRDGREEQNFRMLYHLLTKEGTEAIKDKMQRLENAAFQIYQSKPLSETVAMALYGTVLENSVSRLEKFASCCYAHFLQYGLRLEEKEDYTFENSDLGTIFHGVLELFTKRLEMEKIDWKTATDKEQEEILNDVLNAYIADYNAEILDSSARNRFMVERIREVMTRTVKTLQFQLQKGFFQPEEVEFDFKRVENLEEINFILNENEKDSIRKRMQLHGKIDRIDLSETDDTIYVKVIDYKSGKKDFDLCALYYGLQLQLVMYMNVAEAVERKKHRKDDKKIIPAAILYYRIADPLIDGDGNKTADDVNQAIHKELKMTGLVNADDQAIHGLDKDFVTTSEVLPVAKTTKGEFRSGSSVASLDEYRKIANYVQQEVKEYGKRIVSGDISINPYRMDNQESCTYCSYHSICRMDPLIPGYQVRELEKLSDEEIQRRISE